MLAKGRHHRAAQRLGGTHKVACPLQAAQAEVDSLVAAAEAKFAEEDRRAKAALEKVFSCWGDAELAFTYVCV